MKKRSPRECLKDLKCRPSSILSHWEGVGCDLSRVEALLKILQEGMDYPNHHFLPNDNLHEFINDESYEFSVYDLIQELEAAYSESVSLETLTFSPDATILDFVKRILSNI